MGYPWLLDTNEPWPAAEWLERRFEGELKDLEEALRGAARGSLAAARQYLSTWETLTSGTLNLVREARPDAIIVDEEGRISLIQLKECTRDVLMATAPIAPFSPWVSLLGLRRGLVLRLLAEVRAAVPGAMPLIPPPVKGEPWASPDEMRMALHLCETALTQRSEYAKTLAPLTRVMQLFELERTEFARLFGVSRQAVEQWEERGVPSERWAKLTTILAVGELLARKLRPNALPGVARTKAGAYGGRTILELIAGDQHEWLLNDVRESFDWAATA